MSSIALPMPRQSRLGDLIRWAFGVATVVTKLGKAAMVERTIEASPATYKNPSLYLAMGIGAEESSGREAKNTDTKLTKEKMSRTKGTGAVATTTYTGDTLTVTGSQTATEELKINEAGVFEASSGEVMTLSATLNVVTLANGDSVEWKWKEQLT